MTRQKSESRKRSEVRRKVVPTRGGEPSGGEKATPVNQQAEQPLLPFEPAEILSLQSDGVVAGVVRRPRRSGPRAAPQSTGKQGTARLATLEEVSSVLRDAFRKVAANKGAPGPDRQTIDEVRTHLDEIVPAVEKSLLDGSYMPGSIRRVWIPKSSGGDRGLGIPNVVDRMVQEAVRRVLEPLYEPTFHDQSHGFRPGRGCHTAVDLAREYLEDGYEWVVDLDLEKFFDQVNHQRLVARLAQRVTDKRLLRLVGEMLKAAVVMPDGVKVATEEGVPQGGPLSPLLSNIVLDELDAELVRRGHRFVRYADDCNIYVRSERAGQRAKMSISKFITGRLRLKVNESKSAVARPATRHFLGYRMDSQGSWDGDVDIKLSERSEKRLRERIRELTPRNWGSSIGACIEAINDYTRGWLCHFGICTFGVKPVLGLADGHIRRRLRAIQLKQWKRKLTIARRLIKLGLRRETAFRAVYSGRKSLWHLSNVAAVNRVLSNAHWAAAGFEPLLDQWQEIASNRDAPRQLTLFGDRARL